MNPVVKCPKCTAVLEIPTDGRIATQCKACGATALLPTLGAKAINANSPDITAGFGPMTDKARTIARMWNEARSGNRSEAIRLHRQIFGSDLKKAGLAIDALNAGRPLMLTASSAAVNKPIRMAGCMALVGVFVVAAFSSFLFLRIRQANRRDHSFQSPPPAKRAFTAPKPASIKPPAPVVPSFADMTMRFGSEGTDDGQFDDSRNIGVDGSGHIYVGDYQGGRVQVFDSNGKHLKTWSAEPNLPMINLTADRNGTVYIIEGAQMLRYQGMTGQSLGEPEDVYGGKREGYHDVFCAGNGNLYAVGVPDEDQNDIVILDAGGKIKTVIEAGKLISQKLQSQNLPPLKLQPMRIAANSLGEIFLMDSNKGIFKFSAAGDYVKHFWTTAKPPKRGKEICTGYAMAVDSHDRLFVAAAERAAITVFDRDGNYLDVLGGFDWPSGIAIDSHDGMFAIFSAQHDVRKYAEDLQVRK